MEQGKLTPKEKRRTMKKKLTHAAYTLAGIVLLILIWDLIHFATDFNTFPEFFSVLGSMFILMGESKVWIGLGFTFYRLLLTLVLATALGFVIGLLAAFFPPFETILQPLIYFLTSFPTASMIFVLIIYTKITCYVLVFLVTFPIIYKVMLGGGKLIIKKYEDPLKMEGRYSASNFFHVEMPLSLPYLFMGLAQATGLGLKVEIMGEVFMSDWRFQGIGAQIHNAYYEVDMTRLFALTMMAILAMSLVELALYFAKRSLKGRFGVEPTKVFHLL